MALRPLAVAAGARYVVVMPGETTSSAGSGQPTIAIVGRPNVGKSTLFNRLTGSRAALVSDLPGLTRDRRFGEATFGGHAVRVVDTAGLERSGRGSIAARMREQTERAIAAADVVLFVVDAREGVTPADLDFAKVVRQSGRPAVVVANKCEGRTGRERMLEAFELGLGEPVAISAEHGEGLADLEDDVLAALGLEAKRPPRRRRRGEEPDPREEEPDETTGDQPPRRPIRVAVVGRPNSGKSTLVNALLGEDRMITGPEPGLTRDSVASEFTWKDRPFLLFDTAGLRRKARITETAEKLAASDTIRALRFAEVVVLLIDAERPFEQQDLLIGHMAEEEGRALVVAVNKWDLVTEKQKVLKDLRETLAEKLAQMPGLRLITISAIGERGLDQLMAEIVASYEAWNRRIGTAALNRWLEEALQRHAPPASRGRRIKIRYMTQPSTRPPSFVAFCSNPQDLPKSYLKYLTNSLRSAFELPGVPIRFALRKGKNPFAD